MAIACMREAARRTSAFCLAAASCAIPTTPQLVADSCRCERVLRPLRQLKPPDISFVMVPAQLQAHLKGVVMMQPTQDTRHV
jgi:hypothetical protein